MSSASFGRTLLLEHIAAPTRNALVGGPFGSDLVTSDYTASGVPVIRGENLWNRWVSGEFVYVSEAKAEQLSANTAGPLDVVFTQRGANHYRQVSVVPPDVKQRFVISQSQMKLTVNDEIADPLYVYYWFRDPAQQQYLQRHAIETGVPHTNLSILRKVPVVVPSLHTQRGIIEILSALDDKLELNRRTNETLEAMVRALFKSWFIDFDPVRAKAEGRTPAGMDAATAALFSSGLEETELGEIPLGWKIVALDSVAHFLNGLALQRWPAPDAEPYFPVLKITQLRAGSLEGADKAARTIPREFVIRDGDLIFSWSGSLLVSVWSGGECALNQHLFKVTSSTCPQWFVRGWLLKHLPNFQRIASGKATTMGHIQRYHLTDAKIVLPGPDLLAAAGRRFAPYEELILGNLAQNRTLADLLSSLLPKLLSGELRVREAERIVERAV